MPITPYVARTVIFTVPIDGHRHRHLVVLDAPRDEAEARRLFRQNNPDARLVEFKAIPDDVDREAYVLDKAAAILKADPNHRPLVGDDFHVTEKRARKLANLYPDVRERIGAEALREMQANAEAAARDPKAAAQAEVLDTRGDLKAQFEAEGG